MDKESTYLLMLAAARYACSRSPADRAAMLSVGREFWEDFPAFLVQMKHAIAAGHGRRLLRQDNVKHLYALLFVGILNGLDAAYLNKVGGALLAAAMPAGGSVPKKMRAAERGHRILPAP